MPATIERLYDYEEYDPLLVVPGETEFDLIYATEIGARAVLAVRCDRTDTISEVFFFEPLDCIQEETDLADNRQELLEMCDEESLALELEHDENTMYEVQNSDGDEITIIIGHLHSMSRN
jgi:hypothetical protein